MFPLAIQGIPAVPMIWTLRLFEVMNLSLLCKWVHETVSSNSFVLIEKAKRS